MSNIIDNENKPTRSDGRDSLTEASGIREWNLRKKRILVCGLAAILLICIGIVSVLLFGGDKGVFSANAQVTVSFDSTGGSAIESQTVQKGGKLAEVGMPARSGYVFAGWYYEEAPVSAYKQEDVFNENTTLYAGWYEPDMKVDKAEYIKDCDSNISFVVRCEAELTEDNLSDYIKYTNIGLGDGKTLSVKQQDGDYLLYSQDGFTPGFTYSIEILDLKKAGFVKAGGQDVSGLGITSYNFTVHRENENNVVLKAEPKLLSFTDVSDLKAAGKVADGETGNENDNGKTIYRTALINDADYKPGDVISLGSGDKDAIDNQYYKVFKVNKERSGVYLDLITPNMDEIYSDFQVYYSGEAATFEEDTDETAELERDLQASLKQSKGYDYLCEAIAGGIKKSPTLLNAVGKLAINNQKKFNELSLGALKDLLKNVNLDMSFGKTKDIKNEDNGFFGQIKFTTGDIEIDLAENIKLTINLTMSEDITATVFGWYGIDDDLKLYTDSGLYLDNKFSMSFNVVVATDSGTMNITEEIQNLVNAASGDKTQSIVDNLNKENLFGEDLDYIEVLSKQIGEKTITVYEVLSIQFTLDFKVSLGMRAGLELNFNSAELRKIGMCNIDYSAGSLKASKTDMKYYNNRLRTELHFDATLKGKVGVRAGFEAGVNFSVVHLNKVLNFGFAAEIGVYEEISGYLRFDYDYKNVSGTASSNISLAGGLMSETGIYVELSFTWNLFGWDDSVTIAEAKFPILTIGALEFASEFEKNEDPITFNTNSYNIKSGSDNLLRLKYVDISGGSGGVTINIRPASLSGEYAFFLVQDKSGKGKKDDLKYVSLNKETGIVSVADNAPDRLDFTVVVQYTKGCSLFSKDLTPITKNINFTYMKYKVDDSTKKYNARFYKPDGSLLEQKEFYVGQTPVPPAADTYENLFISSKYKLKSWSKPWKESLSALYNDADFHFDYEMNYKNITFSGYVYNETAGKHQYGVIAVVPTLCGEMPTPPSPESMNIPAPWRFYRWDHSLKIADADDTYTAEYIQRDDICWTSFYVGNRLIANDFPKIGTMPKAPDMSEYNDEDSFFYGWSPSLYASTERYASYTAMFRPYVNVTFKGLDDKVISQQRIRFGETPKAPEAEEIVEGEEDYYEYYFRQWANEKGVKVGPVYGDTVYSPVYDKHYLEVTTKFDAGGHTFADGTKIKEFKGTYRAYNFLYMPQVTYRDNENSYTVDYWQSTKRVNGSYVKLYMKDIHTDYKYNLTFKPVFKTKEAIVYTVRFDGGDETIYLTGHYGDIITSDMLTGLKKTSPAINYVYRLSDYGLKLPYSFGSTLGTDGLPAEYISVVARFDSVGVDKTFTFDANGGKFADDKTVKTVTAPYGTRTSFNEAPAKASDYWYNYTFAGWSSDRNATTGSSFSDFIINGDLTLYAAYGRTLRDPYTITFDAGDGHFAGGKETIEQAYAYGETIIPPDDPVKDADAVYRYVFIGWQPALTSGTTVTASRTYTASYRTIRIDGTLEETGIYVSDGSKEEDINVGSIPGYTYALVGEKAVPTLTVTGNGLTFRGASDEVCVVLGSGVTNVMFNGLTLSGAYAGGVINMEDTSTSLTINISGVCTIRNTQNGEQAVRFERPVLLNGAGMGAKLSISAKGCSESVFCGSTLNTDSLELEITALKREGDDSYDVTALGNDGSSSDWQFNDSVIRFNSEGIACSIMSGIQLENSSMTAAGESGVICSSFKLSGASIANLTASGSNAAALRTGELKFSGFTGSFSAASTHPSSPGVAVMAFEGIKFEEGGAEVGPGGYDLGGKVIGSFSHSESGSTYSSFGIDSGGTLVPASAVTVTKP